MRAAILILTTLTMACGPSLQPGAGEVTLEVEPAADSVVLTLRNGSEAPIYYNLCTSTLERQSNGTWETVPSERMCTMELRTLDPGADANYTLDLSQALAPGSYRYRTSVEVPDTGERSDVISDPFRVDS